MKCVVVGGCGFLGSYVTTLLRARGDEVISVHRSSPHPSTDAGIVCVSRDYRDTPSMIDVLSGASALIHLGSQSVPRTSATLGVSGILEEVEANAKLFEAAADVGVANIVFASSGGSVYGDVPIGAPIPESQPTEPISPHGLLKVMTELALAHVARVSGLTGTSLRPANIYGPGQMSKPSFGIVPTFLSNLLAGCPSEIWGADATRDYVFVSDAAEAFVAASSAHRDVPIAINVGTGVGHTAVELYALLQDAVGVRQPVTVLPRPRTDPAWSVLDPSRWQSALGGSWKVGLKDGLAMVVQSST